MLANATRICEAGFGNLFLREGPIFRSVAVHSKQQSHADFWRRNPVFDLRDNPGGPLDHIAKTKQIVHIGISGPISLTSRKKINASLASSKSRARER